MVSSKCSIFNVQWRFGILVGIFLALLSLYPQIYLKFTRGENYNGATFLYDFDEQAYAAYLQTLIDGRPRKNNLYSGVEPPENAETLYTIQFFASYLAAIPAKIFGISAETAFIIISPLSAFFASLALFWMLAQITKNERLAAFFTLFVLIFGALAAGNGALKQILGLGSAAISLPFLRRYTPAVAFPFFFLLCTFAWLGIKAERLKIIYAFSVGICFAVLVYSYFYLWTAALAWLVFLALSEIIFRTKEYKIRLVNFWLPTFTFLIISLIPYVFLLQKRPEAADGSQALQQTRTVLLFNSTLIVTYFVLTLLLIAFGLGWLKLKNQTLFFILSFAFLPVLVFNQQVFSGYSLQLFHYNLYIANYSILIALALMFIEIWQKRKQKIPTFVLVIIGLMVCGWGVVETHYAANYRLSFNIQRDEAVPVNRRLAQIGKENYAAATSQVTLNFDLIQADNQPAIAPQAVLWSEHLAYVSHLSAEENHRRYFLSLYYRNKNENWLSENLKNCPGGESCQPLFGWRINRTLSLKSNPPSKTEILQLVREYKDLINSFGYSDAANPVISFVIVPDNINPDFSKIDLWYERGRAEKYGSFLLFPIKLKTK